MKIYTTSKARILFVSVPEETNDCDIENNILYADSDKWVIEKSIPLPEGDWTLLSLLKDATEEQAASVVDELSKYGKLICYRDYCGSPEGWLDRIDCFDTSVESLHSLANHLGCEGNQVILVEPNK